APRASAARATRASSEPARSITAPESRSPVDALPELDAAMLSTDPGVGAVMGERASGPLAIGRSLPVRRGWLLAVGVLAVTVGATAAWVMFLPTGEPAASGALVAASAIAASPEAAALASPSSDPAQSSSAVPTSTTSTRGTVDVRAPSGARVEVDGVDVGAAPMRVELGTGTHQFRIVAPGYAAWSETVEVGSGDNPLLEARLKPSKRKPGSAKLEPDVDAPAEPDEAAEPTADEAPVDATPLPDKALPRSPPPVPVAKRVPPVPEPKGDPTPFLPTVDPAPETDPLLPTQ
ncbi:MAG: PEGA domain-containing protein, partial [Deltaproteobacteria bacterium]|nr:PEGA domain-containing protein [Nannocystaceae bacterium]